MAEKITIAEKFAATIAILEGREPEIVFDTIDAVEFLQDRAEKAKSKPRERKVKPETAKFREDVGEFVLHQPEPVTAKIVAEALGVSTQKASATLRFLVVEGELVAHDGKKARDAKTYEVAR